MACLSHEKIQAYIEKNLGNVERSLVRDHLIVCEKCRETCRQYEKIENALSEPAYVEVPEVVEKYVLRKLFSQVPTYTSVLALVAVSFVFLVSWIYIYFDFANNSLVQAFKITSSSTSKWISSIIQFISAVFSGVYTVIRTLNKFFEIVFNINISVELFSVFILVLTLLIFYGVFQLVFRRGKSRHVH
jgi:predicted anti-sigma-YlaC factor YlaD